jgi:cytochrome o ubiquinol oxidase operon protein cyoD
MKTNQNKDQDLFYKQSMHRYLTGFLLSLVLTLIAYFLVTRQVYSGWILGGSITALALLQAFVQLSCFLGLTQEKRPHWNLLMFFFMLLVLLILVFGSLWIMYELNYNLMDMSSMDMHSMQQEGL